ncbi:MAG: flagellar basal body-associated FliL family protein [Rhodobacteraceae bacterium]|nr:flagellar basal body-associated FliL family protein [Paracoccaceae bacterium]
MTDAAASPPEPGVKRSKLPLLLGIFLAMLGGGAGYFSVSSGIVRLGESPSETAETATPGAAPEVEYVPIDPMIISLNDNGSILHLRFSAQIEVDARYKADVTRLMPRIVDVLNTYMRALDLDDLRDAQALTRLRVQMLRRIQVVVGEGRIGDLLIMEFVLS